ncbi:MAG TPA: hypothetical protein VIS55_08220 [Pseudomonadales bacterium]
MLPLIILTALSVAVFLWAFWLIQIVPQAKRAIDTAKLALVVMRDPELEEIDRERAVQRAATRLVLFSGSLFLRSALCLVVAFIPVYVADLAGLAPLDEVLAFMALWETMLIASLIVTASYIAYVNLWRR